MLTITFILRYNSFFGENLFIEGDIKELSQKGKALPMEYTEHGWIVTVKTSNSHFHYSYHLINQQNQVRAEKHLFREFCIPTSYEHVVIYDVFQDGYSVPTPLLSSAFTKSIMCHDEKQIEIKGRSIPVSFNITWPNLPTGQDVKLIGNTDALGNWNEENAVLMNCSNYPEFCAVMDANKLFFPLEYKYVISDKGSAKVRTWEDGFNHYLPTPPVDADFIVVNDGRPRFPIADFKGAGTAVPVFSLRSHASFGVGEFADLKLMADWAKLTGQRIIQMLPINDTTILHTKKDSYPYSSISVFALHPMYLHLDDLGEIPNADKFRQMRDKLNAANDVDYEQVNEQKWEFIRLFFKRDGAATLKSAEFLDFYNKNKHWLCAYAVFSFLRDLHKTANYEEWDEDAVYNEDKVAAYCKPSHKNYNDVAIHFYVQYHLDKQLKDAVAYAHQQGIAMKGDIPIGVNRHSVEVWMNTRLFDCNGQAGAPPDFFSKFGQNWGFPIYNWNEMKKDGYSWWCNRLKKMSDYFDAYRIDHILGFFRIFRIPSDAELGLLGQFAPALAMTKKEIDAYGVPFNEDMCKPFIHDDYLDELFGDDTELVKKTYLKSIGNHRYQLKKEVDNQIKINALIPANDKAKANIRLGLKILTCQVLFVKDMNDSKKYHPRISMGESYAFKALTTAQKEMLGKLYNDFFFVRNDKFWGENAMEKLPALIKSSAMMVCGEDLGMVPDCVHPVMEKLDILSLEIQRMPKDFGVEFGDLRRVPYMSVCTSSSHDMSTMRQWWEEDREVTQRYFNNVLHEYGPAPLFCEPWVCQRIIEHHLGSDAMWVILPLQDWMAMDGALRNDETFAERINDPGNPDNYWHYRMHICLEDLIKATMLNQKILSLVKYYGR